MRILNPKYALATLLFAFVVWLAMTGKLTALIDLAKTTGTKTAKTAEVVK